jgi:hypothetical protein
MCSLALVVVFGFAMFPDTATKTWCLLYGRRDSYRSIQDMV